MKNSRIVDSLRAPRLGLLLIAFVTVVIGQESAAEPLQFRAKYLASAYGFSAKAERYLIKQEDGSYLLRNKIEAQMLGATVAEADERSSFLWRDDKLLPLSYSYEQSGVSTTHEQIDFDWEANTAISVEDDESWTFELEEGVIDKLAYQLRLRNSLMRSIDSELEFQVIDTDEIEVHHYRVVGEEVLTTELGRLNTLKIERKREESEKRGTIIWLATDWNFLMVGLEQTDRRGRKVELKLDRATIEGEVVEPLP